MWKQPQPSELSTKDFDLPRSTEKVHDRSDDYNDVVAHVSTIGADVLGNGTDKLKSRIHDISRPLHREHEGL